MIITFEGRDWDFDEDDLDVKQATVLWKTYQMTISEWSRGFATMDQRAYHFTYWLMLAQNGEKKPIEGCNPPIIQFISAVTDARIAEAAEVAAAAAEAARAEPDPPTAPSLPVDPPSPAPGSPTATTPAPRSRPPRPTASG